MLFACRPPCPRAQQIKKYLCASLFYCQTYKNVYYKIELEGIASVAVQAKGKARPRASSIQAFITSS